MISKILLGLFFAIVLFQANQVYGDEALPSIITIDFISDKIIDLDDGEQMLRAEVQILNYAPSEGYHYMQIIRLSDQEIIKDTEIFPKVVGGSEHDDLYEVQILHYLEPDEFNDRLLGDYGLRIYSELGSSEALETFSIIKSSMPVVVTESTIEELVSPEEESDVEEIEESETEELPEPESQIPSWVHDIFVWYADETISENELLTALQYLIEQEILVVGSD